MKTILQTSEYISKTSREYAIYVAENRAIPKLSDGLKDGQRKALWLTRYKHDKIKTVALAGSMIAEELFVHGDTSASETISALAAPYLNNICYLDGIGEFGSKITPNSWGAPRYTYVKRSKAAQDILYSDLDIVPMMDNYDGSNQSAATFLPIIPTVLLNGISGIAVGWSTEILPHKFSDLVNGCLSILEGKQVKQLRPYYDNYDLSIEHIENNSWLMRGKIKIQDSITAIVTELPPGLKLEKFREMLDNFEENDTIQGYTDKSTKQICVHINFKRAFLKTQTEDSLIDLFKIKSRVTERIVVIDLSGRAVKVYDTHHQLFDEFVSWRLEWYVRRYEDLLAKAQEDLIYANAIKMCFEAGFASKLQTFQNKKEVYDWVMKLLSSKLKDEHINRIISLPSYKWSKENYNQVIDEIKDLKILEKSLFDTLNDGEKIIAIYKDELLNLKKKYA